MSDLEGGVRFDPRRGVYQAVRYSSGEVCRIGAGRVDLDTGGGHPPERGTHD